MLNPCPSGYIFSTEPMSDRALCFLGIFVVLGFGGHSPHPTERSPSAGAR